MRYLGNTNGNEPLGVIHVIAGGPSYCKGKNKCSSDNVLSVEKDTWAKQDVYNKLSLDKSNLTKVSYLLGGFEDKIVVVKAPSTSHLCWGMKSINERCMLSLRW